MQSTKKLLEFRTQGTLIATCVNLRTRTTKSTIMMTAKTIQAAIAPVHEADIPSSAAETNVEQFDFTGSQVVVFITSVVVNASVVVIIRSSLI